MGLENSTNMEPSVNLADDYLMGAGDMNSVSDHNVGQSLYSNAKL